MNQEILSVDAESIDWWPHRQFSRMIGKGEQWAWGKIKEGKWTEGEQFVRDPDGQVWVSIKGWKQWLTSNSQRAVAPTEAASKSGSAGAVDALNLSGRTSPRAKTSKRRPVSELR